MKNSLASLLLICFGLSAVFILIDFQSAMQFKTGKHLYHKDNLYTSTNKNAKPVYVYTDTNYFSKKKNESTIWPMIHSSTYFNLKLTSQLLLWGNLSLLATTSQKHQVLCKDPKETTMQVNKSSVLDLDVLMKNISTEIGGRWRPSTCKAPQKVALLVPYRNRSHMLGSWLRHMHQFLQKQNLEYRIFIAEQDFSYEFNRAMLLNIATKFAIRMEDFDCLIYHDIDQIPVMLTNKYVCDTNPLTTTHYATYVDCRGTRQPYAHHFGLVASLTPAQFLSVNGYSNLYFGWGSEDDDMSTRIRTKGYKIKKKPGSEGRYTCLKHKKAQHSYDRLQYARSAKKRITIEGYNTLIYDIISFSETPLFTWIYVHIDKGLVRAQFHAKAKGQTKT